MALAIRGASTPSVPSRRSMTNSFERSTCHGASAASEAPNRLLVSAPRNEPSACATSSGIVIMKGDPASVSAQYQRLDRQQQRLDTQQQGVHEANAVDDVQGNRAAGGGLLRGYL